MSLLWVIEGLTGEGNRPVGKWFPLWNAFKQNSGATRAGAVSALKRDKVMADLYREHKTYTKFRVVKYVRAE